MPADHRPSSRRSSGSPHPLITGVVIGVVLGVGLSVGVAIWLKGFANPFLTPPKAAEPAAKPAVRAPKAEERAEEKGKGDKPRFDFYTVLPGEKGAPEAAPPARTPPPPAKDAPPKEPVVEPAKEPTKESPKAPAEPPKAASESLWLQAGAFADPKDAENMRVQIALSGLDATVKSSDVPGRGRLHRVRVGPFATSAEANRVKASLSQNGITTTLIRNEESR